MGNPLKIESKQQNTIFLKASPHVLVRVVALPPLLPKRGIFAIILTTTPAKIYMLHEFEQSFTTFLFSLLFLLLNFLYCFLYFSVLFCVPTRQFFFLLFLFNFFFCVVNTSKILYVVRQYGPEFSIAEQTNVKCSSSFFLFSLFNNNFIKMKRLQP